MANNPSSLRKHVRAKLHAPLLLKGTDREGRPFEITGQSNDFSRTGLGAILDQDVLVQGSVVTVTSDGRFQGVTVVQWIRRDAATGRFHVGLRLLEAKTSFDLKIAAGVLLFFAFLNQASFGQSRQFTRAAPQTSSQTRQPPASDAAEDEDTRSWIEQAIAKAVDAKTNSRHAAVVNIKMSKESYRPGETVAVSGYRLSNPSNASQSIELKTFMTGPGVAPISVGNVGSDGLYVLSAGSDEEYGPLELLPVSANMPAGQGEVSARILDPVTGEIVGETTTSFTLATGSGRSPQAPTDRMPLVIVDSQLSNSSYRSGDTVELAAYKLINQGATPATVEVKVWLEAPGLNPIAVFSLGADSSLVLTPGADMELRPLESFKVPENLPSGNYGLKSRVLNPVTGEVFHETGNSFVIQ